MTSGYLKWRCVAKCVNMICGSNHWKPSLHAITTSGYLKWRKMYIEKILSKVRKFTKFGILLASIEG